jgi:hypothetical protein
VKTHRESLTPIIINIGSIFSPATLVPSGARREKVVMHNSGENKDRNDRYPT